MTNVLVEVSEKLAVGPGSYLVAGKLSVAYVAGTTLVCSCELRKGETAIDSSSVVLAMNREIPITLLGTAVVEDRSEALSIVCRTSAAGQVGSAGAVQLIAVAVDQVRRP